MFDSFPSDSFPVVFSGEQWNKGEQFAAYNPVDIITVDYDDSYDSITDFVVKHKGKFIAGFITYEYALKTIGIDAKYFWQHLPAAEFRAYEKIVPISFDNNIKKSLWESFIPTISKNTYNKNYKQIIQDIQNGEYYQLNYTYPMHSTTTERSRNLFASMIRQNQTGFSAYIEGSGWAIHSFSPEQFVKIEQGIVTAKPIKGTIPRGQTAEEDNHNLNRLLTDEKEQAELYMIIDLLRNDVGKVSQIGSVNVQEIKSIQKLEKVFHTYGVITGKLRDNISPIEALMSMLPGGSITGCPKKRACQSISDLETTPRGVYTGTIGYIRPDGTLHFNIAIRTVVQVGCNLTLGVGGGITIGSNPEEEYNETLAKGASLQP